MTKLVSLVFIFFFFTSNVYAFWIAASGPSDIFFGTDHGNITSDAITKESIYTARSEIYSVIGNGKFGVTNGILIFDTASKISSYNENIDGDVLISSFQKFNIKIRTKDKPKKGQISKPTPEFHCDDDSINNCSFYIKNTREKVKERLYKLISDYDPDASTFDDYITVTRKLFGYATHTLQDFYSHSNWIEQAEFQGYNQVKFTWGNASDDLTNTEKSKGNVLTDHIRKTSTKTYTTNYNVINPTNISVTNTIKRGTSTCTSKKDTTILHLTQLASGWYHDRWEVFNPKIISCPINPFCDENNPDDYFPITKRGQYYPNQIESDGETPIFYLPVEGVNVTEYCQHGDTKEGAFGGNGLEFGIHKDSPHRHLHEGAVNTALRATTEYLQAILGDVVTEAQQKGYPNEYIDYVILKFLGHDVELPPEFIETIDVSPAPMTVLFESNSLSYNAILSYKDSSDSSATPTNPLDITNKAAWTSSDTNIVKMTSTGRAEFFGTGTVIITASYNGISGSSELTVTVPCFDSVEECTNPDRPVPPACEGSSCDSNSPREKGAHHIGDPHVKTHDKVAYDLHVHGEMILTKSSADEVNPLEIQSRPQRWRNRNSFSADIAYGMRVNEDIVGFYLSSGLKTYINHEPVELLDGFNALPSGGQVYKYQNKYSVVWPDGSMARVRVKSDFMEIEVFLNSRHKGKLVGLFGNFNDDISDELRRKDGSIVEEPIGFDTLYKDYAMEWRITNEESLFDYFEPDKFNTEAYTDLNYPIRMTRVSDLRNEERTQAEQLCNDGGVTVATPILFDNCVLDIAATDGVDLFTDTYRTLTEPKISLTVIPPPRIEINGIEQGQLFIDENVVLSGKITSSAPITALIFQIDGGNALDIFPTIENGSFTYIIPRILFGDGQHQILISASDDKGSVGSDSRTITMATLGTIRGSIIDAVTRDPVIGVIIEVFKNGTLIDSQTTGNFGSYEFILPSGDGYIIQLTKLGYIDNAYENVEVSGETITYLETILIIDSDNSGLGEVSGSINNAFDGQSVSGLTVNVRAGANVRTGEILDSTTTNSSGNYTLPATPAGTYTLEITGDGFTPTYITVVSIGGTITSNQTGTITPIISSGETRVVLTWGPTPSDLDSYMSGPLPDGSRFVLYYPHSSGQSPWPAFVNLNVDDTTGGIGPETITVVEQINGEYRYAVHNYSNRSSNSSAALSNSGAKVTVYRSDVNNNVSTQIFNIPTNQIGTIWRVFEMNGDTLTPINQLDNKSSPASTFDSDWPN